MKKLLFIFIGCLFAIYSYSQSLYLDNGVSFSRLNNNYNKTLTTYRVEAGVNYLNRSLFFLSSGVGFQEMGGRFDYLQIEDQTNEINHTVNASVKYITINSLINFKYEKQNWMTYLGVEIGRASCRERVLRLV